MLVLSFNLSRPRVCWDLCNHGVNTYQEGQFMRNDFTHMLKADGVRISMNGGTTRNAHPQIHGGQDTPGGIYSEHAGMINNGEFALK